MEVCIPQKRRQSANGIPRRSAVRCAVMMRGSGRQPKPSQCFSPTDHPPHTRCLSTFAAVRGLWQGVGSSALVPHPPLCPSYGLVQATVGAGTVFILVPILQQLHTTRLWAEGHLSCFCLPNGAHKCSFLAPGHYPALFACTSAIVPISMCCVHATALAKLQQA